MARLATHRRTRKTLSIAQRSEIALLLRSGEMTQAEIARAYGVSRMTVSRIANPPAEKNRERTPAGTGTSVYLKEPERDALDRLIRENGYRSRSHLIGHLVRSADALVSLDVETAAILRDMASQLRGVAVNINQMARAANRSKLGWTDVDKAEMNDLARGCGQLSRQLSSMVSGSARKARADVLVRRDGDDG